MKKSGIVIALICLAMLCLISKAHAEVNTNYWKNIGGDLYTNASGAPATNAIHVGACYIGTGTGTPCGGGGGAGTLQQVLTAGNSTGNLDIISPDTNNILSINNTDGINLHDAGANFQFDTSGNITYNGGFFNANSAFAFNVNSGVIELTTPVGGNISIFDNQAGILMESDSIFNLIDFSGVTSIDIANRMNYDESNFQVFDFHDLTSPLKWGDVANNQNGSFAEINDKLKQISFNVNYNGGVNPWIYIDGANGVQYNGDFAGNGNHLYTKLNDPLGQYEIGGLKNVVQTGPSFTGTGLNDFTFVSFNGNGTRNYLVTIDSVGATDTFSWSDGFTSGSNIPITGAPQVIGTLGESTIQFGATTGHTLNDDWLTSFNTTFGRQEVFDGKAQTQIIGDVDNIGNGWQISLDNLNQQFNVGAGDNFLNINAMTAQLSSPLLTLGSDTGNLTNIVIDDSNQAFNFLVGGHSYLKVDLSNQTYGLGDLENAFNGTKFTIDNDHGIVQISDLNGAYLNLDISDGIFNLNDISAIPSVDIQNRTLNGSTGTAVIGYGASIQFYNNAYRFTNTDGTSGQAFITDGSGNVSFAGLSSMSGVVNQSNGGTGATSLLGAGIPHVIGNQRVTAQTATVSLTAIPVGVSDATFDISANVNMTAVTLASFQTTCTYTDETNTSRTLVLNFSQINGTFVTTLTNALGAGAYEGVPVHIRAKAGTNITIASTGTFTTVTYNLEERIVQE